MRDAAGRRIAEFDRLPWLWRGAPPAGGWWIVPGVGAITALALGAVIDQPRRFATSSTIAACLGLTA